MNFSEYIFHLWQTIGYEPSQVELDSDIDAEHTSQVGNLFTPVKTTSQQDPTKFTGIRISSFSKDTDHGQIMEFLVNSGLPDSYKDNVSIKQNGSVLIETLPNNLCLELKESLHNKIGLGRRLYCNGIVPRTPDKVDVQAMNTPPSNNDVSVSVTQSVATTTT